MIIYNPPPDVSAKSLKIDIKHYDYRIAQMEQELRHVRQMREFCVFNLAWCEGKLDKSVHDPKSGRQDALPRYRNEELLALEARVKRRKNS